MKNFFYLCVERALLGRVRFETHIVELVVAVDVASLLFLDCAFERTSERGHVHFSVAFYFGNISSSRIHKDTAARIDTAVVYGGFVRAKVKVSSVYL